MVRYALFLLQYMYVPDTLTYTKNYKTMYMYNYIYMYIHTYVHAHMCCVYVTGHHTLYSQHKVMNTLELFSCWQIENTTMYFVSNPEFEVFLNSIQIFSSWMSSQNYVCEYGPHIHVHTLYVKIIVLEYLEAWSKVHVVIVNNFFSKYTCTCTCI